MVFKAKKVAVIGAGVSGLASAKHLKAAGLEIVIYERSSVSGGVWRTYIERKPHEPEYPSLKPSVADFIADSDDENGATGNQTGSHIEPQTLEDIDLKHGPPGPAYDGLKNNVPIDLQELKGYPWKEGLEDSVNIRVIGDYLHGFSETFGIEPEIKFNTRVEKLEKTPGEKKWRVKSSTLIKDGPEAGKKTRQTEEFDAVVVANGHYHACKVPDIPGLKEWKSRWPSRVQHSKTYRLPNEFKDQNVLLIGSGVSSFDIAKEITPFARKIYQSSRGGQFSLPVSFLPPGTERVGDVLSFALPASDEKPGPITLADGRVLTSIDRVVLCTGYHITTPFLPTLHNDSLTPEQADEEVLITDGTQIHNLHKDIFYIPDPSLAFVGIPFYTATFTLFEIQAIAVSKVFSGQVWVPSAAEMRREYAAKVRDKGYGRPFHSLLGAEAPYVAGLVAWVNSQVSLTGGEVMEGHTEPWLKGYDERVERLNALLGKRGAANVKPKSEELEPEKPETEKPETERPALSGKSQVPTKVLPAVTWIRKLISRIF